MPLDEIDSDGEDEYLRRFFFLLFLLVYRRRFFDFSDRLFGEGLLFSSILLLLEDFLVLLGHFLLRCSFRGSLALGDSYLYLKTKEAFVY